MFHAPVRFFCRPEGHGPHTAREKTPPGGAGLRLFTIDDLQDCRRLQGRLDNAQALPEGRGDRVVPTRQFTIWEIRARCAERAERRG